MDSSDDEAQLITESIGRELRRARDSMGLSRPDFVDRLGFDMPVNTYACYEQGVRPCSIPRLVVICRALNVAVPDLLGLALQRADIDLNTVGYRVDLRRAIADNRDVLRPLRRWARHRLRTDSDDTGIVRLDWEFVEEMAAFLGLTGPELGGYLKEFAPEVAPRR